MGIRGEVFSTRVQLANRTYFFNVKENRMGDLYLNIVESKNKTEGGFERQSVILFADDLGEFLKGFDESLRVLEKAVREKRRESPKPRESRDRTESRETPENRKNPAGNGRENSSRKRYESRGKRPENGGSREGRGRARKAGNSENHGRHADGEKPGPRKTVRAVRRGD
jgi:hypothetical protein